MKREASRALLQSGVIKNIAFLKAVGEPIEVISVEQNGSSIEISSDLRGVILA